MTVHDALAGSDIAKSDAEVLLAAVLQQNRAWLIAHKDDELSSEQQTQWEAFAARKRKGEPVAYILGEREFYGRMFTVDRRVLIPRPCTEKLIDAAKNFLKKPKKSVEQIDTDIVAWTEVFEKKEKPQAFVDVGTGSGCIAITLALEFPDMKIYALDVNSGALEVARANAKRHGVEDRIMFLESNLLEALPNDVPHYLVVANPPYLDVDGETVQQEVREWEPHEALFAADAGALLTKKLMEQAHADKMCVGTILETQEDFAK